MGFDGTEGGAISLSAAAALTKEHRTRNAGERTCHFFGRDILEEILNQEGCMGIRMYYGVDSDTGNRELVLVGADAEGDDILDLVADLSWSCPANCSSSNALNS